MQLEEGDRLLAAGGVRALRRLNLGFLADFVSLALRREKLDLESDSWAENGGLQVDSKVVEAFSVCLPLLHGEDSEEASQKRSHSKSSALGDAIDQYWDIYKKTFYHFHHAARLFSPRQLALLEKLLEVDEAEQKVKTFSQWKRQTQSVYYHIRNRRRGPPPISTSLARGCRPFNSLISELEAFTYFSPSLERRLVIYCHQYLERDSSANVIPARIYHIRFTREGSSFITAADDGLIKIWDSKTYRLCYTLKRHFSDIGDVDVCWDLCHIASCCTSNELRIWRLDAFQWTPIGSVVLSSLPTFVRFAPQSGYKGILLLSTSDDGTLSLYDVKKMGELPLPPPVDAFPTSAFVPPADQAAAAASILTRRPGESSSATSNESHSSLLGGIHQVPDEGSELTKSSLILRCELDLCVARTIDVFSRVVHYNDKDHFFVALGLQLKAETSPQCPLDDCLVSEEATTPSLYSRTTNSDGKKTRTRLAILCLSVDENKVERKQLKSLSEMSSEVPDVCFASFTPMLLSARDVMSVHLWSFKDPLMWTPRRLILRIEEKLENDEYRHYQHPLVAMQQKLKGASTASNANLLSSSPVVVDLVTAAPTVKESSRSLFTTHVTSLCWADSDQVVMVGASIVRKLERSQNVEKTITKETEIALFEASTAERLLSIADHKRIRASVAFMKPNPIATGLVAVGTYFGQLLILDARLLSLVEFLDRQETTQKYFSLDTRSIDDLSQAWPRSPILRLLSHPKATFLDGSWHPKGDVFVVCQRDGCISVFGPCRSQRAACSPVEQFLDNDFRTLHRCQGGQIVCPITGIPVHSLSRGPLLDAHRINVWPRLKTPMAHFSNDDAKESDALSNVTTLPLLSPQSFALYLKGWESAAKAVADVNRSRLDGDGNNAAAIAYSPPRFRTQHARTPRDSPAVVREVRPPTPPRPEDLGRRAITNRIFQRPAIRVGSAGRYGTILSAALEDAETDSSYIESDENSESESSNASSVRAVSSSGSQPINEAVSGSGLRSSSSGEAENSVDELPPPQVMTSAPELTSYWQFWSNHIVAVEKLRLICHETPLAGDTDENLEEKQIAEEVVQLCDDFETTGVGRLDKPPASRLKFVSCVEAILKKPAICGYLSVSQRLALMEKLASTSRTHRLEVRRMRRGESHRQPPEEYDNEPSKGDESGSSTENRKRNRRPRKSQERETSETAQSSSSIMTSPPPSRKRTRDASQGPSLSDDGTPVRVRRIKRTKRPTRSVKPHSVVDSDESDAMSSSSSSFSIQPRPLLEAGVQSLIEWHQSYFSSLPHERHAVGTSDSPLSALYALPPMFPPAPEVLAPRSLMRILSLQLFSFFLFFKHKGFQKQLLRCLGDFPENVYSSLKPLSREIGGLTSHFNKNESDTESDIKLGLCNTVCFACHSPVNPSFESSVHPLLLLLLPPSSPLPPETPRVGQCFTILSSLDRTWLSSQPSPDSASSLLLSRADLKQAVIGNSTGGYLLKTTLHGFGPFHGSKSVTTSRHHQSDLSSQKQTQAKIFFHNKCFFSAFCSASGGRWKFPSASTFEEKLQQVQITECKRCHLKGAAVFCRSCKSPYHWSCARYIWTVNDLITSRHFKRCPDKVTDGFFVCPNLACVRLLPRSCEALLSGRPFSSKAGVRSRSWLLSTKRNAGDYVPQLGDVVRVFLSNLLEDSNCLIPELLNPSFTALPFDGVVVDIHYQFPTALGQNSQPPPAKTSGNRYQSLQIHAVVSVLVLPPHMGAGHILSIPVVPRENQALVLTSEVERGVERFANNLSKIGDRCKLFIDGEFHVGIINKIIDQTALDFFAKKIEKKTIKKPIGKFSGHWLTALQSRNLETPFYAAVSLKWNEEENDSSSYESVDDDDMVHCWELYPEDEENPCGAGGLEAIDELQRNALFKAVDDVMNELEPNISSLRRCRQKSIEPKKLKYADFIDTIPSPDTPGVESWVMDYWEEVEVPISLRLIAERLKYNYYRSVLAFLFDLQLLLRNCERFNGRNNELFTKAEEMVVQILTAAATAVAKAGSASGTQSSRNAVRDRSGSKGRKESSSSVVGNRKRRRTSRRRRHQFV